MLGQCAHSTWVHVLLVGSGRASVLGSLGRGVTILLGQVNRDFNWAGKGLNVFMFTNLADF